MGQSNDLEGQEADYSFGQASLREGNQSFAGSTQGMSRVLEAISRIAQMGHHYSSNLSWGFISAPIPYDDIDAVYRYLVEDLNVSPDRILLYGRSVGGGPSTYLAARKPVVGMILESTFISTFRVVIPIQILPFEKFPNQSHIRQTNIPILLIHGTKDQIIPYWHSQVLYDSIPGPKQLLTVEGADHNDVAIVAGEQYGRTIGQWLGQFTRVKN